MMTLGHEYELSISGHHLCNHCYHHSPALFQFNWSVSLKHKMMTLHDLFCLISQADDPLISWEEGAGGARAGARERTWKPVFARNVVVPLAINHSTHTLRYLLRHCWPTMQKNIISRRNEFLAVLHHTYHMDLRCNSFSTQYYLPVFLYELPKNKT